MPTSDWTPKVSDVAALLRARTKNRYGSEVGTFDRTTRPDEEQATELIQQAVEELEPSLGANIPDAQGDEPDKLRNAAKQLATILAAMNLEMSFFPESVQRNLSPYAALEARFKRLFPLVRDAIAEGGGTGAGEEGTGGSIAPSYEFEEDREVTTFHERF